MNSNTVALSDNTSYIFNVFRRKTEIPLKFMRYIYNEVTWNS